MNTMLIVILAIAGLLITVAPAALGTILRRRKSTWAKAPEVLSMLAAILAALWLLSPSLIQGVALLIAAATSGLAGCGVGLWALGAAKKEGGDA